MTTCDSEHETRMKNHGYCSLCRITKTKENSMKVTHKNDIKAK